MTDQPEAASTAAKAPKKKRHIFLWVFLAVHALFVVWIFSAIGSAGGVPEDCGSLSAKACNDASDVGTWIGVVLIVVIWVVVDFLLAVIYGVYRLAKRS